MRLYKQCNIDAPANPSDAVSATNRRISALMKGHRWSWQGEDLCFLPERAVWRASGRALMVADLHLGKAEVFQAHGIPLPSDGDRGTLNPLLELCHALAPERLILLGDVIHARVGLTPPLRQTLQSLPQLCNCEVLFIGGNHDRHAWIDGLPQCPSQRLGELWLSNAPEPPPAPGLLNICGHLHPMARLRGRADRLRLPCFAFDPDGPRLVIPAFGELTGGHDCGERYMQWLVADDAIVPWFDRLPQNQGQQSA